MNLIMVSVLLLGMLAFQPTLIYGAKDNLATANNHKSGGVNGKGKRHHLRAASLSSSSAAKLVMAMQSGDVLVRAARGATGDIATAAAGLELPAVESGATVSGGGGGKQRTKHNNNNNNNHNSNGNKKSNKHSTQAENAPTAGTRKHLDRKLSAAATNQQQQQHKPLHHHQQQQQHGNSNKGPKERQVLKSQQHQNHGKRSGIKTKPENSEKTADGEKSQSTCRYAKSAWSECDAKTNMRSRTLTLRKGEENCAPTRTMQKKCKKACRYDKGAWSECSNGQMTRQDKLKPTGSPAEASCEALRNINKKCNPGGGGAGARKTGGKTNKERKIKDKAASRRAQA